MREDGDREKEKEIGTKQTEGQKERSKLNRQTKKPRNSHGLQQLCVYEEGF